jgi:hypothetical protein
MSRVQVSAIVVAAIVIFLATLFVSGEPVSWASLAHAGVPATALVFLVRLFNSKLWRWNILQSWFVRRPHIWGRWHARIESQWRNADGETPAPISAEVDIVQTHQDVHVRLKTGESFGDLVCASIVAAPDGRFRLVGTYRNEPSLEQRATSAIHYGTFVLEIEGDANSPERMIGQYWTDRGTSGTIALTRPC